MKFICLQENLKNSLNIAQNIIGRNLTLPILNNVLLITENGRLRISSTNLEIGVNTWTSGKIEKSGAITCPAKVLSNFVNNLPNKKIEMEVKGNLLTIKCDNYKASLNGLPADDFPIIPKIKEEPIIDIEGGILKEALLKIIGAVSLSESRPEITGVLFNFNKKELRLAATDSFRLSEKIIFDDSIKTDKLVSLIIPQKTVQEIIRILGDGQGNLKICVGEGQVLFDMGDAQVISRLIDGQYPDYQQIIPKSFSTQVTVDRSELLSVIRAASVFSSKTSNIKIALADEEFEVLSHDPDLGENRSQIKAVVKGKKMEINFNYRYLLDGLANITTKQVFLGLNSNSSAAVFRPVGDDFYVYLVMPINSN